jgi:GntR family transcriptional regulator
LQVRDVLAARIAASEWKPSVALPNESDLAREFGVSSGTMRKALDLMERERLLTRRQGRGTFVNDQSSDKIAVRYRNIYTKDGKRISGAVSITDISQAYANPAECTRLRLRQEDRVWRIRCVRWHGGEPYMVEEIAMPAALFPGLPEQKELPYDITVLAQRYGILLGKGNERIAMGSASSAVAESLNLPVGAPILTLDRLLHSLDDQVVEWRLGMGHFANSYYLAEIH